MIWVAQWLVQACPPPGIASAHDLLALTMLMMFPVFFVGLAVERER